MIFLILLLVILIYINWNIEDVKQIHIIDDREDYSGYITRGYKDE